MTPDESETIKGRSLDVPSAVPNARLMRRRSYQILAVAGCLALAGVITGIALVRHQRASDEHLTSDALQREELRDGWKALGAAAALDAQASGAPSAAPAPTANVVIVNVPAQSGPAGPPGAPGTPGQTVVLGAPGGTPAVPNGSAAPVPTSVTGIIPIVGPGVGTSAGQSPVNGVVPGAALGQPVSNGSLPGSTPNPALPNNGSNAGNQPSPGLPNGAINGSNPTSNVPSGTSNLPPGSSNLPSGVP